MAERVFPRLLALVCWLASNAHADEPATSLVPGLFAEIKGAVDADGVFRAAEIEVLAPDDDSILATVIEPPMGERFFLLGQEIHVDADTRYKNARLDALAGARVKVRGDWHGARNFSASSIEARDPGRDRIGGRIDAVRVDGEEIVLRVMAFEVRAKATLVVKSATPLATTTQAPLRAVPPDERDEALGPRLRQKEEERVPGRFQIDETLTLGAQLELNSDFADERDLDRSRPGDRSTTDLTARVELVWTPRDDFLGVLSARESVRWEDREDTGYWRGDSWTIKEGYGRWSNAFGTPLEIQVGRTFFDDAREWLYHRSQDGVVVRYERPNLAAEVALSTILSDASQRDQDTTNLQAYVSNNDDDRHAALFLVQRDVRGADERFTVLGGRLYGKWIPSTKGWLDAAIERGRIGGEDAYGQAFDAGLTWMPDFAAPFNVTVGYAYGSGDDTPGDGRTDTFHQPGYQNNNDKWGGVTPFHYYGEIVDPELANLGVLSFGFGTKLPHRTSLDLVVHYLELDHAAEGLFRSGLKHKTDGIHPEIGREVDLVFGWRGDANWQVEVVLGSFDPGAAFGSADSSYLAALQVRFKF
ncbi:MAG: alginate export family protein [Planctomycetes bacterium]|nr:alginate export family protein [Planctomycetota bacterium]